MQRGAFRTNCMDCLDRTNVVQGVFSRLIAHKQLEQLQLLPKPVNTQAKKSPFEKLPVALENVFREGWTDNADVMSYLYTGTPALKTDFTRTGKRTYKGAVNDGINSICRYYINNFTDGYYHDCLDISTLRLDATVPIKERQFFTPLKISILVTFILTCIAKFVVEEIILKTTTELTFKHTIFHTLVVYGTFIAGA